MLGGYATRLSTDYNVANALCNGSYRILESKPRCETQVDSAYH